MSKQIYVNLPVKDLAKSTAFYEALGFTKNPAFSDDHGCCVEWSDEIKVMLLTHDFYAQFINGKQVIDAKQTSGVLLCLSLDSKDEVQRFADAAKANGGNYYTVAINSGSDQMFGYEVEDLDGHIWEPLWIDASFTPDHS